MKKIGILNSDISALVASIGHTDTVTIADCGLPIKDNGKKIDISLKKGVPSFIETIKVVLEELKVESVIIAEEMEKSNPENYSEVIKIFGEKIIRKVPHSEFKIISNESKGVIRTGECSPYANIILQSGVIF